MGELLTFMMRLHGSSIWDEIVPDTGKQVAVVSATINNPTVKTDTVDINTYDGVLDFSDVQGIHYGNRDIKVTLRKIAGSTYDFDALRRKYLGQLVDCRFETTSGYYYYGRLTDIEDDYQQDFRTITLTIDAHPFRRPVSGKTTVEISVGVSGDFMPSADTAEIEKSVSGDTMKYVYKEDSFLGKNMSVYYYDDDSSEKEDGAVYLTVTGLTVGNKYTLSAEYTTSSATIRSGSKTGAVVGTISNDLGRSLEFTATSAKIVICFTVKHNSIAYFDRLRLLRSGFTVTHLDNGDKIQTPTYNWLMHDITIHMGGDNIKLSAGSTINPYFSIPRGGCDITATSESTAFLQITYEQEVL